MMKEQAQIYIERESDKYRYLDLLESLVFLIVFDSMQNAVMSHAHEHMIQNGHY